VCRDPTGKSFLLLFFKKEESFSFAAPRGASFLKESSKDLLPVGASLTI
jgi:hypothetical protein